MNKQRRKDIDAALNMLYRIMENLEEQQCAVEDLATEEGEYRDNIPENLMESERYEKADAAAEALEEAAGYLRDAYDLINDATTSMEEAKE